MTTFTFNGVDFTEYLDVAGFEMPAIAEVTPAVAEISGRDGAAYMGSVLQPLTIIVKARLATDTIEPAEIQRQWAIVAAMMRTEEPAELSITPGIYRKAVLQGQTALEFNTYSANADLSFYCPDPVAYGNAREVSVPSGGLATFVVGGTYPAAPTVVASSAVRDSQTGLWRLRLDDGGHLAVPTGTAAASAVTVDCLERTCTVNGAVALPTLESDWFTLGPGEHTVSNDLGSGACTISFRERWL